MRSAALSSKDLLTLLNVLRDHEQKPFDALAAAFRQTFMEHDAFRVGCSMVMLIDEGESILPLPQRLGVLFILYDMYKHDKFINNPFLSVFVPRMREGTPNIVVCERLFATHLFHGLPREMCKWSPVDYANEASKDSLRVSRPNLADYEAKILSEEQRSALFRRAAVKSCCKDPDEHGAPSEDATAGFTNLLGFEPPFLRLAPPLYRCDDNSELIWLNLEVPPVPLWDASMCVDASRGSDLRDLIEKGLSRTLLPSEQQQCLATLEADPKIVYHCGISPDKLPALVENNPTIAIEVLLNMMSSNQITEYFSVLVNMEMSLHSMEVVNKLTTAVELPKEFIHLYISNCINACNSNQDKYMQSRLVRLLCVFLQSLIRNNIIDVSDFFVEVQAFCIEFIKIREAAGLFRLLKSLGRGG